ncbi:MAG: 30S ribosomal protein S1 [Desulfovibrionaceae bacterium]|nr:30S ribosomal protein S1 [Desulfovibrionaceae bacterium]
MTEEQHMHTQDDSEDFAALFEQQNAVSGQRLEPGQKVSGTIIEITGDNVFVDVGLKVDGVMDRKDILDAEGNEQKKPGDTIEAWVVSKTPQEIRLSLSMSGSGVAALEEACAAKIPVEGRVTGTCKGGYSVEIMGKRAFCPGSQMEVLGQGEEVAGRTVQFLITRVENNGRNIVVSHRALIDRERAENLDKVLANLHEGDTVDGKVTRLAPFGAFVELAPGVEGLVHISELAWSRVGQPEEVVNVGEVVHVKVLGINQTDKGTKISLSRKQASGDPWDNLEDQLSAGKILEGKVVRLMPFGAFVEVLPGVEGMVHVSEMAWGRRVHRPEEIVQPGDTVQVKILDINMATHRLSLSMRDAEGDPWADCAERFAVGTQVTGTVESQSSFGIFVNLAPAITGLLPAQAVKNAKNHTELLAKAPGDSINVVVQRLDLDARKISLLPEGAKESQPQHPKEHRENKENNERKQNTKPAAEPASLGILGQALQKALEKKRS